MALQLPLNLGAPQPRTPDLWILTAPSDRLRLLRQALGAARPLLIDAIDGRMAIPPTDAVLVRTGPDAFEAFGAAAEVFADAARLDEDMSEHLLSVVTEVEARAVDLIAFGRGALSKRPDDWGPVSQVEQVVWALRHPVFRADAAARLRICERVLDALASNPEQKLLFDVVAAQAQRLSRKVRSAAPAQVEHADFAALVGSALASCSRCPPSHGIQTQLDLFSQRERSSRALDLSLAAFPVTALRLRLKRDYTTRPGAAFLTSPTAVTLREDRLARLFTAVESRRIVTSTALDRSSGASLLDVRIDWEVRRDLSVLCSERRGGVILDVWLETRAGAHASVAKRTRIGEDVSFDVRPELRTSCGGIAGVAAFGSNLGVGARTRFRFDVAA